ncbi:MAG: LysR family transcriptional regulator, partial [Oscillospiraceae bacterium]|nr:LysR family transcriptional regulator [Candidatus Equicaccousia limihippi]
NISYDWYRVFYYVAKYGNLTKVAELLRGSQPNISRSLKNLEQALGCNLFERSNRGVTLTPEGEKLYGHISVAFEHIFMGEEELLGEKALTGGIIDLAASETALHGLLLLVLPRFCKNYPDIKVKIANGTTKQSIARVTAGLSDLALCTTPTGECGDNTVEKIIEFKEIAVAGKNFAHLKDRKIGLAELVKYPTVSLGKDTKTYEFYSRFLLENGLTPAPDIEVATADLVLPTVKAGLGIGFMPEFAAREAIENGDIIKIDLKEEIPLRYICMITPPRPVSIATKELIKIIRKQKTV